MKAIRAGLWALVAFSVLAFGGVQQTGQAVLEVGAAVLLVVWGLLAFHNRCAVIPWNPVYWPLLGLGAVALAQQMFGGTIYAYATKVELLKWGAALLLVFLLVESMRRVEHVCAFIWFLISLSFGVSLFGIVQHFSFNGKLYWLLELPAGAGPFGPFVNRDHFAGFIELTAPLGLALLLFRAWKRENLLLLTLLTVIPVGALFLSASRGGIISFVFECVILAICSRARRLGRRQLLGVAALAGVAATFVVWLGVTDAIQRFAQLAAGEISRDRRTSMYRDAWHIFQHNPWTGTGLGTLVVIYPQYETYYDGLVVDHAHNDYLELLADTGLAGGLCGFAFVAVLFLQGLRNLAGAADPFLRAIRAGPLAGCAGILLHSLVDFNLHIPSNGLLFLLLAALATLSFEGEVRCGEGSAGRVGAFPN